jgi:hypothetical protein
MKELELKNETKIEISVKQKKQVEHELIGKIIPHEGHIIWQINKETLEIEKAKFSNANYHLGGENKKKVMTKDGYAYVSALNKKNALRKYKQGKNGSKPINEEPLSFF